MKTIKTVFVTLILLAILAPLAGLGFVYSGVYDVSASSKDGFLTRWVVGHTRHYSIKAHSQGLEAPLLNGDKMLRTGFSHYRENCAGCHGAPGVDPFEGAKDMNPPPPDLAEEAAEHSPEHLFWVIKNGIKMTGMPAWGPTHTNQQIWAMVAFLKQLPNMSAGDYQRLNANVPEEHDDHGGHTAEHPGTAAGEQSESPDQSISGEPDASS